MCFIFFKVAEKRKTMIDEMAIERQRSEDSHKEQMEKMEEEYKVWRILIDSLSVIQFLQKFFGHPFSVQQRVGTA